MKSGTPGVARGQEDSTESLMRGATASLSPTRQWLDDALERIQECPVCRSNNWRVELSNLTDLVCLGVPGQWALQRCENCKCASLNPRPNEQSIGDAYKSYYTHSKIEGSGREGWMPRLKMGILNSYLSKVFDAEVVPRLPGGWILVNLFPEKARIARLLSRGLDGFRGLQGKVLDIGCGNGAFLKFAGNLGWAAYGIEPDPQAAQSALQSGGVIIGAHITDIEKDYVGVFDSITLNHVLEHVHSPVIFLGACWRMLKPGGMIWMETPNIDSAGYELYGRSWRGLEPPRHLVLFNGSGLVEVLKSAGFIDVKLVRPNNSVRDIFAASEEIAAKERGFLLTESERNERVRSNSRIARKMVEMDSTRSEVLIAVARKKAVD